MAVTVGALPPLPALPCLQIDQQFKPKEGGEWAPGYHGTLYNLTDDAIQVWCGWMVAIGWQAGGRAAPWRGFDA